MRSQTWRLASSSPLIKKKKKKDITVFEKSVPSTVSLNVDLCDCFLIIRLRVHPRLLEISPL